MTTYTNSSFTKLAPMCPGTQNICELRNTTENLPSREFYNTYLEGTGSPVIEFSEEYNDQNAFYEYENSKPSVDRTITHPPCEHNISYTKPYSNKRIKASIKIGGASEPKSCFNKGEACNEKTVIYDIEKQPCYYNINPTCSTVEQQCKSYEHLLENNYRNQTLKHILEEMVPFRDDDGSGSYCLNNCSNSKPVVYEDD